MFPSHAEELKGLYITGLNPTGVAAQHGQIREGDRILEVDRVSLKGMENMEAAAMLRNSGSSVRLLLSRRRKPSPPQPQGKGVYGYIMGYLVGYRNLETAKPGLIT